MCVCVCVHVCATPSVSKCFMLPSGGESLGRLDCAHSRAPGGASSSFSTVLLFLLGVLGDGWRLWCCDATLIWLVEPGPVGGMVT